MNQNQVPIWTPPPEYNLVTKQVLRQRFLYLLYSWIVALVSLALFRPISTESTLFRLVFGSIGGIAIAAVLLCHFLEKPREVRELKKVRRPRPPVIY